MHLLRSYGLLFAAIAGLAAATNSSCGQSPSKQPGYCTRHTADVNSTRLPRSYGYLMYPAFEPLDIFGPVDALMQLSWMYRLDLHFISETLNPVSTRPSLAAMNPKNSSSYFDVLPSTTLKTAPDLDVLLIPGGIGSRSPNLNSTIDFIRERYPKVKYLISICTGALLASKSGVLDGKRATTNKKVWKSVTSTNDKVHWVPEARWVTDGNVWSSSGVAAGTDAVLAFIKCMYGDAVALNVANGMEYERHIDANYDPFAKVWNVTGV